MTARASSTRLLILSDIHFAGADEQARGNDFELVAIRAPLTRAFATQYRYHIWMRDPFSRTQQFERFMAGAPEADLVVVNGDFSCDSAFLGLADPAARASAAECIARLRERYGAKLHLVTGDHEAGKKTMFSGLGGMRLAGWEATQELGIPALWQVDVGRYSLIAVASPLLALPANVRDALPDELPRWEALRAAHLAEIRALFGRLGADRKIILFCHDPTALPYLAQEEAVRQRFGQIEQTIIGHLHSKLILWKSRLLSGIPPVQFLGPSVAKFTRALSKARAWKPFKLRLCPALAGIELLDDGGYFLVDLDPEAVRPAEFHWQPLPRKRAN